jgi:hypothetical protein
MQYFRQIEEKKLCLSLLLSGKKAEKSRKRHGFRLEMRESVSACIWFKRRMQQTLI